MLVLVAFGGYLTLRILTKKNDVENVSPSSYLLSTFQKLDFTDSHGGQHEGWLLYGLRGAPVVILCPGYDSNRSELLWLGTVLQQNHFNVYLFNYTGPKAKESFSNLGIREASDTLAAIQEVTKQVGVNPHRVGLYGVTTGAYAALAAAEQDKRVSALVMDAPYERPSQMFLAELDQLLGSPGPVFRFLTLAEFHLFTLGAKAPPVVQNLSRLRGRPEFFIAPDDIAQLADATEALYKKAPEPKRLLVVDHLTGTLVSDPEKKEYESQVLNFFLQHLPLRAD